MKQGNHKQFSLKRRQRRVRAKVSGSAAHPRLAVFRSLRGVSVQVIDDAAGRTLAAASFKELGEKDAKKNTAEQATLLGKLIADKCRKLTLETVVFDRAGYRYHGKVKAVAEGARQGGLIF